LGLALRNIGDVLESDGRLFATLLVFGPGAETRLRNDGPLSVDIEASLWFG